MRAEDILGVALGGGLLAWVLASVWNGLRGGRREAEPEPMPSDAVAAELDQRGFLKRPGSWKQFREPRGAIHYLLPTSSQACHRLLVDQAEAMGTRTGFPREVLWVRLWKEGAAPTLMPPLAPFLQPRGTLPGFTLQVERVTPAAHDPAAPEDVRALQALFTPALLARVAALPQPELAFETTEYGRFTASVAWSDRGDASFAAAYELLLELERLIR